MRELIENRGKLDADGLSAAADVAFRAYEADQSRTFDRARFTDRGRDDVANTLLAGGILVHVGQNRVAFFHHWYHDYLASKHVAEHPALWSFENRHHTLDALTFKANSFDAIAFALELLPVESRGEFLQAVFDWNPYAAGYALSEAGISERDIPRETRLIILAMLAEKRFDRHFLSARRASDALDLLSQDDDAEKLRSTTKLSELLAFIASIDPQSDEFASWQRFFILKPDETAPSELVEALMAENSMFGWTAANVLKRVLLTDRELDAICCIARHSRAVVRWRAVHTMGAFSTEAFRAELLDRLDRDTDENVRYGALRSLVEIASRDPTALPGVASALVERLDGIAESSRLLGELSNAVFLAKGSAPPSWAKEISRIFYALLDRAEDPIDAERWSTLASRVRVHHRDPRLVA